MRVGFVILAHERPAQTGALARLLAGQGAPVVVHYDRRAEGREALRGALEGAADLIATQACEWGMMGLVDAALDGARHLLDRHPALAHICLLSGSCWPLRPLAELDAFLAAHEGVDFIESVPAKGWVQGGLDVERFTLYHPFGWKRRQGLFDLSVAIQRRLGIARRMPAGLQTHLGSQWWCLSTASLRAILSDPNLPAWRRFFRRSWIPDESFFQTILRRAEAPGRIDPRPLTLARFDPEGNPVVFHDDHAGYLASTDYFFARKIDPDARALRAHLATGPGKGHAGFEALADPGPFEAARARGMAQHRGRQMAGRFPRGSGTALPDTAAPYWVLIARDAGMLAGLRDHLMPSLPGFAFHGWLFGPGPAAFATAEPCYGGNLAADPNLRDYRPEQFIANLRWIDRQRGCAFLMTPDDSRRAACFVFADPNARLVLLGAEGDQMQMQAEMTVPLRRRRAVRLAAQIHGLDHQRVLQDPAPLIAMMAEAAP